MADRRQSLEDIIGDSAKPASREPSPAQAPADPGRPPSGASTKESDPALRYSDTDGPGPDGGDTGDAGNARDSDAAPSKKATAALIVGALALLGSVVPIVGLILAVTAIVLGVLARKEIDAGAATGAGKALVGLAVGGLALLAGLFFLIFNFG